MDFLYDSDTNIEKNLYVCFYEERLVRHVRMVSLDRRLIRVGRSPIDSQVEISLAARCTGVWWLARDKSNRGQRDARKSDE